MAKPSLNELLKNGQSVSSSTLHQLEDKCGENNVECGSMIICRGCNVIAKADVTAMALRVAEKIKNEL